jgi:hypothetical protein
LKTLGNLNFEIERSLWVKGNHYRFNKAAVDHESMDAILNHHESESHCALLPVRFGRQAGNRHYSQLMDR